MIVCQGKRTEKKAIRNHSYALSQSGTCLTRPLVCIANGSLVSPRYTLVRPFPAMIWEPIRLSFESHLVLFFLCHRPFPTRQFDYFESNQRSENFEAAKTACGKLLLKTSTIRTSGNCFGLEQKVRRKIREEMCANGANACQPVLRTEQKLADVLYPIIPKKFTIALVKIFNMESEIQKVETKDKGLQ